MVYEEWNIWGPYKRKDNRFHMCMRLKADRHKRKTVSYPKYLMELHLGRYLTKEETVDHIDGNKENNSLDNLQIVTRSENASKGAIKVEAKECNCVWCGGSFILTKHQIKDRTSTKAGPFCSRKCSGAYGADVQNGGRLIERDVVEVLYYSTNNSNIKEYVTNPF